MRHKIGTKKFEFAKGWDNPNEDGIPFGVPYEPVVIPLMTRIESAKEQVIADYIEERKAEWSEQLCKRCKKKVKSVR